MIYDLTTDRDTKKVTRTPSKSEIEKLEESWNHKAAIDGASEGLRELAEMMAETARRAIDAAVAVFNQLAALNHTKSTINRDVKVMIKNHTGRAFRSARKAVAYYKKEKERKDDQCRQNQSNVG